MNRAPLTPHKASTGYALINLPPQPKVVVTEQALAKMSYFIGISPDEVGWLGTVDVSQEGENTTYLIDDVYLFDQEVSAVTTEIDPTKLGQAAYDLIVQTGSNDVINRLRLWGHSHVNMETNPSGQDDAQMDSFSDNGMPYMIRLIGNKKGHMRVDIYEYAKGIIWYDLPWKTSAERDMEEQIKAELQAKVKKLKPPTTPLRPGLHSVTNWKNPNQWQEETLFGPEDYTLREPEDDQSWPGRDDSMLWPDPYLQQRMEGFEDPPRKVKPKIKKRLK